MTWLLTGEDLPYRQYRCTRLFVIGIIFHYLSIQSNIYSMAKVQGYEFIQNSFLWVLNLTFHRQISINERYRLDLNPVLRSINILITFIFYMEFFKVWMVPSNFWTNFKKISTNKFTVSSFCVKSYNIPYPKVLYYPQSGLIYVLSFILPYVSFHILQILSKESVYVKWNQKLSFLYIVPSFSFLRSSSYIRRELLSVTCSTKQPVNLRQIGSFEGLPLKEYHRHSYSPYDF